MGQQVSPNKLNARDQRQVENIRDRLRSQGVGEDEATKRAIDQVVAGEHSGAGGGSNAAGESAKATKHDSRDRTGSRSGGGK